MLKLIVFSGIPASGKTTLSKQLAEENNYIRISMDEGGYLRHSDMIDIIVENLKKGKSVVADSVYDLRIHRENLLNAVKDIECECICMVMGTPLDECIRRNKIRTNPIPTMMIECIHRHYEQPTMDEGWDEIQYTK